MIPDAVVAVGISTALAHSEQGTAELRLTHAHQPLHRCPFLAQLVGTAERRLHFVRGFGHGQCATTFGDIPFIRSRGKSMTMKWLLVGLSDARPELG